MTAPVQIFDRALLRGRRDRAAAGFARHAALHDEIAVRLLERVEDVKRDFSAKLVIGASQLAAELRGTGFVVAADLSTAMMANLSGMRVAMDEEWLPFAGGSFDLVVAAPGLHWVNDLPGALTQIRQAMKPDGLLLAAFPGGGSLHELRACLMEAELTLTGGIAPRLSPRIDMQTASGLLQRAGYQLPVTDQEVITLTYSDGFALMRDLRGMGEGNALIERPKHTARRDIFMLADQLYREKYPAPDGGIEASFEIVFLHGWN